MTKDIAVYGRGWWDVNRIRGLIVEEAEGLDIPAGAVQSLPEEAKGNRIIVRSRIDANDVDVLLLKMRVSGRLQLAD